MKKKFNIVDVIIAVFVIAVVVFLVQKFSQTSVLRNETDGSLDVIYTLKVSELMNITADAVPSSGKLYDDEGNFLGTISDKKIANAEVLKLKADGQYTKVTNPDKFDVYLAVESKATLKDEGYFLNGKKNIGVGSVLKVRGSKIEFEAYVVEIS